MDVLHEFLSKETLSTKVISLQDLTLGLLLISTYFGVLKLREALKSRKPEGESSDTSNHFSASGGGELSQVKPPIHLRRNIANISDALRDVIDNMASSQYVLKDKVEYRSIFQTPVRDNLYILRNLAAELEQSAHGPQIDVACPRRMPLTDKTGHKAASKAQKSIPVISTANIFTNIVPCLKDYACAQHVSLEVIESAHGFLDLPVGMAEKILRELVLNAIRHNPSGTSVTLRCSFSKEFAIFEVKDDGRGLRADVSENIYGASVGRRYIRNRRLSDAETSLNVASISALLRQVGGALELSTALGWGTSIRVLLPSKFIVAGRFNKYSKRLIQQASTPQSSKQKVLYIGKYPHHESALHQAFDEQYHVARYSNFDQGLQAMFSIMPDIVIADFSWQHALGIQFSEFMRGDKRFSALPFILITAALDQDTRVKIYASGVSAILEKPLDTKELLTVANNFIVKRRAVGNELNEDKAQYQTQNEARNNSANSEFTGKLGQIMLEHYHLESFNRFEASELLHISEKTLQRRMSKHFGLSFAQYLRKYRLHKARDMLLNGDCITQVTFDSGFNSTSHFGQCFKQEFGHPPSMLLKADQTDKIEIELKQAC